MTESALIAPHGRLTDPEILDLDRRRREPRIWWQYLAGLGALVAGQLVMAGVVAATRAIGEPAAGHEAAGADQTGIVPQVLVEPFPALFLGLLSYAAVTFVLYRVIIRFIARRRCVELGRPGAVREGAAGLGLGVGLVALSVGIVAALGGYRADSVQVSTGILVGLAVGVGPGVAEEIFFRGILLRLLDKQIGSWAALAVTSILFGAVHLANPGATVLGAVALMLEAGALLGAAYLLTRRLWLVIGLHVGWNFALGGIFGGDVSGTGLGGQGLLRSTVSGPDWLTGGSMGLEGSAVTVVVCGLAGVVLVVLAHRRGHLLPPRQRKAERLDLRRA